MRRILALLWLLAAAVFVLVILALPAGAAPDPRYCTTAPARASDGRIARSRAVIREFKRLHPCPSTGKSTGACPGWSLDHRIPLSCCGVDEVSNIQWLPNVIKSGPGVIPKDRWERDVYCNTGKIIKMPDAGRLEVVP